MIGPTIRQGPHHGAQASSNTGLSLSSITWWKLASVTMSGLVSAVVSAILLRSRVVPHLPHLAICSAAWRWSTRFLVPHLLQATTGMVPTSRLFLKSVKEKRVKGEKGHHRCSVPLSFFFLSRLSLGCSKFFVVTLLPE